MIEMISSCRNEKLRWPCGTCVSYVLSNRIVISLKRKWYMISIAPWEVILILKKLLWTERKIASRGGLGREKKANVSVPSFYNLMCYQKCQWHLCQEECVGIVSLRLVCVSCPEFDLTSIDEMCQNNLIGRLIFGKESCVMNWTAILNDECWSPIFKLRSWNVNVGATIIESCYPQPILTYDQWSSSFIIFGNIK